MYKIESVHMNREAEGDGHEDQSGSLEVWLVFLLCHWTRLLSPELTTPWNPPGAASGLWEG